MDTITGWDQKDNVACFAMKYENGCMLMTSAISNHIWRVIQLEKP